MFEVKGMRVLNTKDILKATRQDDYLKPSLTLWEVDRNGLTSPLPYWLCQKY